MTPQPAVPVPPVFSQEPTEGGTRRLFKSHMLSTNYTFPDGKTMPFINGRLSTNIASYISHLEEEIKKGHPSIFSDPNEQTVPDYGDDPLAALRAKIIAEEIAKGNIAMNPDRDMGSYVGDKLNMASSKTVAAAMAGSVAGAGPSGAQLMNIKVK
jgi:hypothetical protein